WSITATDDIISRKLREKVRNNQEIGEIRYFTNSYAGNHFHVFLIPGNWEYELIELKRSGSVWNSMENTYIAHNYEPAAGRREYAEETAGAFYAARLAALEHLSSINRRAKVLVIRDVSPDYWAPLGVWVIREGVRQAFESHEELETMKDIRKKVSNSFMFLYRRIRRRSRLLESRQTSLEAFSR
ncbi:MAG: hypothetical protein ABEJ03_03775, partial [Candidatus Nanohaloarchaea archaeon]